MIKIQNHLVIRVRVRVKVRVKIRVRVRIKVKKILLNSAVVRKKNSESILAPLPNYLITIHVS